MANRDRPRGEQNIPAPHVTGSLEFESLTLAVKSVVQLAALVQRYNRNGLEKRKNVATYILCYKKKTELNSMASTRRPAFPVTTANPNLAARLFPAPPRSPMDPAAAER